MEIGDLCKEIAGATFPGLLLRTKVNPAIVETLKNDKETLKEYITCLYEQKELPFELVHDLRDSSLGRWDKLKMWVNAKAEDKIPGTKITFAEKFKMLGRGNKAKTEALSSAQKDFNVKNESPKVKEARFKDNYKYENEDNKIETKANEEIKKSQANLAKEVQEIQSEKATQNNENEK